MQVTRAFAITLALSSLALLSTRQATAVPYASQVRDTGSNIFEFVLNQSADEITVLRDGANPVTISSPAAGRHTFDMTGFSAFEIQVDNVAPTGWTKIDNGPNDFDDFEQPGGLAVNTDPSSPFFGTVYVANARDSATASGRTMAAGIYALSADLIGVDLANNFGVVADPNDTSFFKTPGFGFDLASTNSPYRLSIDDGGNIVVADFSDASGGIKFAAPDLQTGGLVLAGEGQPPTTFNHGSINSSVYVEGTVGVDAVVYGIDEDIESSALGGVNNLWKWDTGGATDFAGPPSLVIGEQALPTTWLGIGRQDATFSPIHNKWYLTNNRFNGTGEAGLLVVTADTLAAPNNGTAPTIEFNSFEFTDTNGLDGYDDSVLTGVQDILRNVGRVEVTEDGESLILYRHLVSLGNESPPVDTNNPGDVLIIPLDANGIPEIVIEDGLITNWESFSTAGVNSNTLRIDIDIDAAGNIYTSGNSAELIEAFSPGGFTRAITTSAGAFSVEELIVDILAGDFNDDDVVDILDYTFWRDNLGSTDESLINNAGLLDGIIDANDYLIWKAAFGNTSPGPLTSGLVPEPGSAMLLSGMLAAIVGLQRRRR